MNGRVPKPASKSATQLGILCLLAAMAAAPGRAAGTAPTADAIVARYVKVRGGRERLAAVRSLKFTGHVANLGIESPFVMQMKRPDRVRTDMTVNTFPMTQAYDGKTAWIVMPLLGSSDPEELPEAQARDMRNSSSIDGPLVDYKEKGNVVELLGKEEVEGKPAYKLKLTLKDGSVRTVFLDEKSGLQVKLLSTRQNEGGEVEVETFYSDYRTTEGILFPRMIENRIKGKTSSRMNIETVELNPPIDDAIFRKPAPSPAPPPAK